MRVRLILTSIAIACSATPVFGHAFLQHAEPGAGAALKRPPVRIALTFSEKVEPIFSGLAVTDSYGRNVAAGAVVIRGNSMVAQVRPLAPGKYRVVWHVVSVDAHHTEGAYNFAVEP